MHTLKIRAEQLLIRCDGKLNSYKIHNKSNNVEIATLLQDIIAGTSFLPRVSTISVRWWHIKNNIFEIPKCLKCGNITSFNDVKYNQYCTQYCAVTSKEASIRTSKQWKGVIPSAEKVQRSIKTRQLTGFYKDRDATIEKLRQSKLGAKNHWFGKKPWNYQLTGPANPRFGVKYAPSRVVISGSDHRWYGKVSPYNAGRGIHGHFNNLHFRSSFEMCYLIYWYENNIEVVSGETHNFRVSYIDLQGNTKTYVPDFYLPNHNMLYEIKPKFFTTDEIVQRKFNALKLHHYDKMCILGTCSEFVDTVGNILDSVSGYIEQGVMLLSEQQQIRLRKNYNDIIRAVV